MSVRRALAAAGATSAISVLAGCSPPQAGVLGVGVDASGQPIGYLKVCDDAQMNGAWLYTEPVADDSPAVATWDARTPATGTTSWAFDEPSGAWTVGKRQGTLKPDVVYNLQAGAKDGSAVSIYVLFTLADLQAMKPGQVRVFDTTAPIPAGEPTGSGRAQAVYDNAHFMRLISVRQFEQLSCLG